MDTAATVDHVCRHTSSQEHTMRRLLLSGLVLAAASASAASAQNPPAAPGGGIKRSDVAGTWEIKTDSGVASVIRVSPNGKTWTLAFAGRKPIAVRVLASGGDSIVFQAGRFPSVLRPGQTVTRVREVGHFNGDAVTGTYEAHYASGSVLKGTFSGSRKTR